MNLRYSGSDLLNTVEAKISRCFKPPLLSPNTAVPSHIGGGSACGARGGGRGKRAEGFELGPARFWQLVALANPLPFSGVLDPAGQELDQKGLNPFAGRLTTSSFSIWVLGEGSPRPVVGLGPLPNPATGNYNWQINARNHIICYF